LFVAVWITRPFRSALKGVGQSEGAVDFWTAVVQLCALLAPVVASLIASLHFSPFARIVASSIVIAACGGALFVVLFAVVIVAWATPETERFTFSANDANELKQLMIRLREFRAYEVVRAADAAAKGDGDGQ
jgi:hypothetical protein